MFVLLRNWSHCLHILKKLVLLMSISFYNKILKLEPYPPLPPYALPYPLPPLA